MPGREFDEYERDEEMLESRRLKRLEMKRKRKIQQRIVLGVAFLVLVVIILLIVRGCSGREEEKPQDTEQDNQQQEEVVTPPPADPDVTATLAAVGDIMAYQSQIDAAQQDDLTYNFKDAFSAVSAYTANALNQYTQRTIPGFAAVRGEANTNAAVTVNENSVVRRGAYFFGGDFANNSASSTNLALEIYAGLGYTTEVRIGRLWADMRGNMFGGGTHEIMAYIAGRQVAKKYAD